MNKVSSLKKQITICSNGVGHKQDMVEKLRQQLYSTLAQKNLMPVLCIAVFFTGILHSISPLFRRVVSVGAKFIVGQGLKHQMALGSIYKLSKKIATLSH